MIQGMALTIVPLTFRAACAYVKAHHRHHKPPRGMKFCLGVADEAGTLRGVAIVGRPVASSLDDGFVAEVCRTCTDGHPNANSCLYGAAWRCAKAMGYIKLITYTQADETGASLRAAGFRRAKDLAPRKGWAESSVKLRHLRDPKGSGGVPRIRWEIP